MAQQGGKVAGVARQELEARTGKKGITALNAKTSLRDKNISKKGVKNVKPKDIDLNT